MCLRPVEHIRGQMTLYTDDVKRKTTKLLIDWCLTQTLEYVSNIVASKLSKNNCM